MRRGRKSITMLEKPSGVSCKSTNFDPPPLPCEQFCYEGESLDRLLESIKRAMESTRLVDTASPHKIWLKKQFCIGVNDVTRVLERMPPVAVKGSSPGFPPTGHSHCSSKVSPVHLQAILLTSDCNPRWLTRHLPIMASTRKVPLIFVKDKKGSSVRLGELVKLKSAIAIGVKVKDNAINQLIQQILHNQ